VAALLLAAGTQAHALNLVWTNAAGGDWSATNNWDPNQTPGTNDAAFITNAGVYTVTLSANVTLTNLTLGGSSGQQTLATTNFSLTLVSAQPSLVDSNGVFLLQGGLFSGPLTVSGQFNWTAGQLGNSPVTLTVTTNGVLTLAGIDGTDYTLGEDVTNSGTILLQSGNLNLNRCDYWGEIDNLTNGLVDVRADVSIDGCGPEGLANQGTVRKSAGTGATGVNAIFINNGTLDVQTGTVSVNGTGGGGGFFKTEAGATLAFGNDYEVAGVLSGAGTNVLANGTFTLTGSLATSNTTLAGATLAGAGAVVGGLITWTNGVIGDGTPIGMTLAANGVLVLAGIDGADYSMGEFLTNAGTVLLQSGNLDLNWNQWGEFINLPGALVNIASDVSIDDESGGPGFFNQGTVRKSGGTGVTGLNAAFNNSGTLDVQTGTVDLSAAYSLTNGALNFGINSQTNFGQVVLVGNPAALAGSVSANLNNGYVPGVGSSFAVVTFAAGSGVFTNAILPSIVSWQTNYATNAFRLTVTGRGGPLLTAPQWLGSGQFQFSFNTVAGSAYTIQYSTNLLHWISLIELQGNGTSLTIIDLNATGSQRYYRIVSP
jgi:hypothetical protein